MKHKQTRALFKVSVGLISIWTTSTYVAAQISPAHVESGVVKKNPQKIHDDLVLPASIWHDTLWIVDTDTVDSGNGSAISGMSIFGVVYDLSLADDFDSPGGICTQVVHDYLNFNGGGYSPATDYLVEFFADAGDMPANTASTVLTGTSYSSSTINISWWGPGTRITANISAPAPAGTNWCSPSPVDTTSSGDWYYGARQYGTGIGGDAHGRDGGAGHGTLYGGPYGGGYGTGTWTSMGAMGYFAGDWSCQISGGGSSENLIFYQSDIRIDNINVPNSEWGNVDFTFIGSDIIRYFNLTVNDIWQVINMPVTSVDGWGNLQTISYSFDLGNEPGVDVTDLNYGYAFTDNTLKNQPGGSTPASVNDRAIKMKGGIIFGGGDEPDHGPPAKPEGEEVIERERNIELPNQQCGIRECVPAAISNSMKFLKAKHNLSKVEDKYLSIKAMKKVVKWRGAKRATSGNWPEIKADRINTIPNLSITTVTYMMIKKVNRAAGLAAAMKGLKDNCDVEINGVTWDKVNKKWGIGHTAAVAGMDKLKNGKYEFAVKHDTDQTDDEWGLLTEPVIYDPVTGILSGGYGFDKRVLIYIVVECVDK